MKQRVINGITVLYDEKDLFSVENAVYVMKFPESGRFYYGSNRDPSDRLYRERKRNGKFSKIVHESMLNTVC